MMGQATGDDFAAQDSATVPRRDHAGASEADVSRPSDRRCPACLGEVNLMFRHAAGNRRRGRVNRPGSGPRRDPGSGPRRGPRSGPGSGPGTIAGRSFHAALWWTFAVAWGPPLAASDRLEFFETRIRPVLVAHCYECHSSGASQADGNLRLDFRQGLLDGGDSGPAVVPGEPDESLLLEALRHESLEMPPGGKLSDDIIADFARWIRDGAIDPRDRPPSPTQAAEGAWQAKLAERRQWWSLQPPRRGPPPDVADSDRAAGTVDRFILAKLARSGIAPAARADAATLLRRLSLVLTGLPPQPPQVLAFRQAFAADADRALRGAVDGLLDSPHFGERFARHWMDVVRYTDTFGYEWDNPAKGSWEYRDYLIRAFNQDVGFDQMIREQLAGDLLDQPRVQESGGLNESLIGPMFFHMGEHRHGTSLDFNGIHQEMIDNKIDAFSKAFLGMTVACARCHDHKLDAISQADYYALAGVFMSPRWTPRDLAAPTRDAEAIRTLERLREEIRDALAEHWTTHAAGQAFRPQTLRQWAMGQRSTLAAAGVEDVAYPLGQLLNGTVWIRPEGLLAHAEANATELLVAADGSVLARGEVPETDTYTLRFTTGPGTVSLLRLEALTDDSLGGGGPGRTDHGNFVLSHIKVEVAPLTESRSPGESATVTLASASADFSQAGYPVEAALDPSSRTGWGIGGVSPLNVERVARFGFQEPVELPHGGAWTVTLEHGFGSRHVLGRFRVTPGDRHTAPGTDAERLAADAEIAGHWRQLAAEWAEEREQRLRSNGERFRTVTDFSTPGFPPGWAIDGAGMRHGYVNDGTLQIAIAGDDIVQSVLSRGYHTGALSTKLAGAIRPPRPETLPGKLVSLRLAGGEWAGRIDVPQNAFQAEGVSFFDPQQSATWHAVGPRGLNHGVTRVLTEFCTASLNPNFPPRTGLARSGGTRLPDTDLGRDKRSWLSVTEIVSHDDPGSPADTLDVFAPLYATPPPDSVEQAWQRLGDWLAGAVHRWGDSAATAADVRIVNWLLSRQRLPNDLGTLPQVATLVERYRQVESSIGCARAAMSMDERGVDPVDYRLNIRGDVDDEGPAIPRGFLEVFDRQRPTDVAADSGRLELADHLAGGDNPLVARVYVNRVWQWVFGTGLVATPDDFGHLGDRPSHPELLDWLALRFMEDGWSTKRLLRRLLLSRTFSQSGTVDPLAARLDPDNRLLHHYPTRRLEAEAIRDSLLAVSGQLNRALDGPPVDPPRAAEDSSKRLFSGPWDGHGRRSLYTTMSIMEPPKFLVGFNLPDLKLPTGRRDQTNVPAQALILLNDPFVTRLAELWAERLLRDGRTDPGERIDHMFRTALGREPHPHERQRWVDAAAEFSTSQVELIADRQAWAQIAHTLFNTKEFIYYR